MTRVFSVLLFLMSAIPTVAQTSLSGTIRNGKGEPVGQAAVQILEINQTRISDEKGGFVFSAIPNGTYTIEVTALGYKTVIRNRVSPDGTPVAVELEESAVEFKEITVWGNTRVLPDRNTKKTEIITTDQFKQKGYLTIAEALTSLPGVAQITTGPGVARPVIRGSGMNNIATVVNGVKLENQQWDAEHALGITQFGIDRVEVVKGPTSFLYGSEGLGGMLHFVDEKPAAVNTFEADAHFAFNSNTVGELTDVGVRKSTDKMYWTFRAGFNNHSDYYSDFSTRVANSRFRELVAKGAVGFNGKKSITEATWQFNLGYYGIVEPFEADSGKAEEEDHPMEFETPYHTMMHHTVSLKHALLFRSGKLNLSAAYQNDLRKELEPGNTESNPFLGFNLNAYSGDVNLEQYLGKRWKTTLGAQAKMLDNKNSGYAILIPQYEQQDLGVYLHNRVSLLKEKILIEMAVRYDQTRMNSGLHGLKDSVDYMPAASRDFTHFSRSIGINYLLTKDLSVFANAGSGYRAPNMAELTSNGIRLETQRYEKGNVNFKKISNQMLEGGFNYENKTFELEITGYLQQWYNQVFIARTSDTIQSFLVYQYLQSDARVFGLEAKVTLHPAQAKWLNYAGSFSSIQGTLSNGQHLPMTPPYRMNHELVFSNVTLPKLSKGFVRLNGVYTFKQTEVYVNELITPGYLVINLGVGGEAQIRGQAIQVVLGANNLLNKQYVDHLSRLRMYGVNSMGANAYLSLIWKFSKTITP